MRTLIKTTQDGRKLEVSGLAILLDGALEAFDLTEVKMHPNRAAIHAAAPDATHMAGRVALNRAQVKTVEEAFARAEQDILASPAAINERFRLAMKWKTCSEGIE